MSRPSVIELVALALVAVIGVVVGLVVGDVPWFTMQTTVDPVALLALLMSILATLVLFVRLEKHKHREQLRKEVTIERIRDCRRRLEELDETLDLGGDSGAQRRRAVKHFRMCGGQLLEDASALGYSLGAPEIAEYHNGGDRLWQHATENATLQREDAIASRAEVEKMRRLLGKWERLVILKV